jgi:hypothetical protein
MGKDRVMDIWETMVELGVATDEEISLAIALCSRTEETLNQVLYIRTGYRTIEQFVDESYDTLMEPDYYDPALWE